MVAFDNDIVILTAEDSSGTGSVCHHTGVSLIGCNIAESGIAGSFAVEGDFGVAGKDPGKVGSAVDSQGSSGKDVGIKDQVVVSTAVNLHAVTVSNLTGTHIKGTLTGGRTNIGCHVDITGTGNDTIHIGIAIDLNGITFTDDDLTAGIDMNIVNCNGFSSFGIIEAARKIKDQSGSVGNTESLNCVGDIIFFSLIFDAVGIGIVPESKVVNGKSCAVDHTESAGRNIICQFRSESILEDGNPDILKTSAIIYNIGCPGIIVQSGINIAVTKRIHRITVNIIRNSGKVNNATVDIDNAQRTNILPTIDSEL